MFLQILWKTTKNQTANNSNNNKNNNKKEETCWYKEHVYIYINVIAELPFFTMD